MSESLEQVMTNAASGLSAQSIRMNTIASNLSNAGSIGGSEETTYHKKFPIFKEVAKDLNILDSGDRPVGGVEVTKIENSKKPLQRRYDPESPQADKEGYVYMTDVNPIEEMTNMIAASKEYEANVDVMNTTKSLLMQSISVLNTKE